MIRTLTVLLVCLIVMLVFAAVQIAWLKFNGSPVPRPDISREPVTIGNGPAMRLLIVGDSTSVSQGSTYQEGYVTAAAHHLAKKYTVTYQNFGVSGARASEVAAEQMPQTAAFKPDMAIVAVGANDITHLTPIDSVRESLLSIVRELRKTNPDVRIIVTGAPDMGSIPRLPQPLRWIAGNRTVQMNSMVQSLVESERLTLAPIAAKTGPIFRKDPTLFAADKFHPNAKGYALWNSVMIDTVDKALAK